MTAKPKTIFMPTLVFRFMVQFPKGQRLRKLLHPHQLKVIVLISADIDDAFCANPCHFHVFKRAKWDLRKAIKESGHLAVEAVVMHHPIAKFKLAPGRSKVDDYHFIAA